ncbi:MAG: RDD family protein [Sulfurospirillum sp.]|nr:MAG: RDD family protein [Sulfurospirillum sp.]
MLDEEALFQKLHREGLSLATVNRRGIAMFIDEMLISILFFFIIQDHLSALTTPQEVLAYTQSLMPYVLAIKILYQALFVGLYGATLGKMAVKIKVVDQVYLDIPAWGGSFIRAVMRVVSEILFYFGFVVALFSPLKLTWHDKFAKTLVVDA